MIIEKSNKKKRYRHSGFFCTSIFELDYRSLRMNLNYPKLYLLVQYIFVGFITEVTSKMLRETNYVIWKEIFLSTDIQCRNIYLKLLYTNICLLIINLSSFFFLLD